jgi:hypothetical protein
MAAQIKAKTKAMSWAFEDCVFYGDDTSTNEFDGWHVMLNDTTNIADTQRLSTSGATGVLTIALMDQLMDAIPGGRPDIIVMNRTIRRRLSAYLRTVGSYQTDRDDYGNWFLVWNEVPIFVSDWLTQTEAATATNGGTFTAKTGSLYSSVFAVKFGEGEGIVGLQNGGIDTETFPHLETKDAQRVRIKWYVGQALFSPVAIARIVGCQDGAVTA